LWLGWYDSKHAGHSGLRPATPFVANNEWGYSNRLVDLTQLVAEKL
jgi:hypothetical protein